MLAKTGPKLPDSSKHGCGMAETARTDVMSVYVREGQAAQQLMAAVEDVVGGGEDRNERKREKRE